MKNLFLILIVVIGATVIWTSVTFIPRFNLKKFNMDNDSEVSFRENYKDLIINDLENDKSFLTGEAKRCKLYRNFFPYTTEEFELDKTKKVLEILNDSNSYRWGEIGTPDYKITLVFYDENGDKIGFSKIDLGGEVDSKPYRSLMKWGLMKSEQFTLLSRILSITPEN